MQHALIRASWRVTRSSRVEPTARIVPFQKRSLSRNSGIANGLRLSTTHVPEEAGTRKTWREIVAAEQLAAGQGVSYRDPRQPQSAGRLGEALRPSRDAETGRSGFGSGRYTSASTNTQFSSPRLVRRAREATSSKDYNPPPMTREEWVEHVQHRNSTQGTEDKVQAYRRPSQLEDVQGQARHPAPERTTPERPEQYHKYNEPATRLSTLGGGGPRYREARTNDSFAREAQQNNASVYHLRTEQVSHSGTIDRHRSDQTPSHDDFTVPYTTAASEWTYGTRGVLAALKSGKRKCYQLFIEERRRSSSREMTEILSFAQGLHIPIKHISMSSMNTLVGKTSGGDTQAFKQAPRIHDGVCLETSPFPSLPLNCLGKVDTGENSYAVHLAPQSKEDEDINGTPTTLRYNAESWRRYPLLLWLHGPVDMRNVGAIMRTAVYFGAGVILSERGTPTSGFQRTSAGASEYVELLKVGNPAQFIQQSREHGWVFYSAVAPSDKATTRQRAEVLQEMEWTPLARGPCVIVVGNEDEGLPPEFVKKTDRLVSIGGKSEVARKADVDSLNVGIAAAMLIERFCRKPTTVEISKEAESVKESLW